jgi:hypothetical protein
MLIQTTIEVGGLIAYQIVMRQRLAEHWRSAHPGGGNWAR